MEFKAGQTHHALLSGIKPYKIHILAIIDDCVVVYKFYGRNKQWWHYQVKHEHSLSMFVEAAGKYKQEIKK